MKIPLNDSSRYRIQKTRIKLLDSLLFFHHRKINRSLKNLAKKYNTPGSKVLEIGAGTKGLSHKLLFDKAHFVATDIEMYSGISTIMDITNAQNMPDDSFDLIICMNVLEHISNPQKALQEMHRILSKNGELFLVTPFLFPVHDPPHDYYRYTEFALFKMLNIFSKVAIEKTYVLLGFGLLERWVLYYITYATK